MEESTGRNGAEDKGGNSGHVGEKLPAMVTGRKIEIEDVNASNHNQHCDETEEDNTVSSHLDELYQRHPDVIERWLLAEGRDALLGRAFAARNKTCEEHESDTKQRRRRIQRNNSVTSELFHVWVSTSPKKMKPQSG